MSVTEVLAECERLLKPLANSPIMLPKTPEMPRRADSSVSAKGRVHSEYWSSGARQAHARTTSVKETLTMPSRPPPLKSAAGKRKPSCPALPGGPSAAKSTTSCIPDEATEVVAEHVSFDDVFASIELEEKETHRDVAAFEPEVKGTISDTPSLSEPLDTSQWKQSLVTFTQMLWNFDLDATVRGFLASEGATSAFLAFLDRGTDEARARETTSSARAGRAFAEGEGKNRLAPPQLVERLLVETDATIDSELFSFVRTVAETQHQQETANTREEHDLVVAAERTLAVKYAKLLGRQLEEEENSSTRESLAQMAADGLAVLASSPLLERFVASPASRPLIHSLLNIEALPSERATLDHAARDLLWGDYELPVDAAGWLIALASVGETLPACIVLSDMRLPGNPMIYVNPEFCRVTGYSKKEAQGRSCRFLQGPRTEDHAVIEIQDALRRGVDCHVRITNYRKSGELFSNLLMLRPVCDERAPDEPCRFCIGVQFEVTRSRSGMEARLSRLSRLMAHLPCTLPALSSSGAASVERVNVGGAASYMLRMDAALKL